jgi:hypothetical protein
VARLIVWINGAFGAGKSQTAQTLHRRIPHSFLYDPENAGSFIRENIPNAISKPDFQDHPMWREFNYSMLKTISRDYDGLVIAPMTIVNPQYFDEIVGKLRADQISVEHFTLLASKDILLKRLRSRGESENSWAAAQIDRCACGLSHEVFQRHIDTDNMTIQNVVELIASLSNLDLD